jgi:copper(I)-binding protein
MLIHNHGSEPDHLVGVASPVADRVEVHTHTEVDGVMRMGPVEEPVEIPAGRPVLLERGGLHVMFLGLHEPLEDGELIPLTLSFEQAGDVTVEVPVDLDRLTEDAEGGEGDMEHDSMEGMDHGGAGG